MNNYQWKGTFRSKDTFDTETYNYEDIFESKHEDPSKKTLKQFLSWITFIEKNRIYNGYKITTNDGTRNYCAPLLPTLEQRHKILEAFKKAKGYNTPDGLKNAIFRIFLYDKFYDVKQTGKFDKRIFDKTPLSEIDLYEKNISIDEIMNYFCANGFVNNILRRRVNKQSNQTAYNDLKERLLNDIEKAIAKSIIGMRRTTNNNCGIRLYSQSKRTPFIQYKVMNKDLFEIKRYIQSQHNVVTPTLTNPKIVLEDLTKHPLFKSDNPNIEKIIDEIFARVIKEYQRHNSNREKAVAECKASLEIIDFLKHKFKIRDKKLVVLGVC